VVLLLGVGTVLVALTALNPALGLAGFAGVAVWLAMQRLHYSAVTALTLYLALLFLIPGRWVVPSLGALGTPAGLVSVGCGLWWLFEMLRTDGHSPANNPPIRVLAFLLLVSVCTALIAAYTRALDPVEASGATRGFIRIVGLLGVTLLAAEGLRTRERLDLLLDRLLDIGGVFAAIGILQFFTDFDPVTQIRIPGLVLNQDLAEVATRSALNRVASTALHPIEFGAVLAVLFPLALHRVIYLRQDRRFVHWLRFGLIAFAIPLSVSRTAVVTLGVGLLTMWPVWPWRRRVNVVLAASLFMVTVRSLVPGLLGTIGALFTNFNDDPSVQGRTADFGQLWAFVGQRPLFGRGFATFDPSIYFFVDNQIMLTLVSGGIIGLLGLVIFVLGGATLARQVYWHGADDETRHLGASLAGAIAGAFASFFTFDALSFPVMAGLVFTLVGLAGAAWRLEVRPSGRCYTSPRARLVRR
jgi:hypothetical protein